MYYTKDSQGNEIAVRFKHCGGRKAEQKGGEGRAPKRTTCRVLAHDSGKGKEGRFSRVIGRGFSRPVREIPVILANEISDKVAEQKYANRLLRVLKTDDGVRVAILRGDQFSRADGRKEALKKAISDLDAGTRANIKKTVFG